MRTTILKLLLFLTLSVTLGKAQPLKSEVLIISTIHGAHEVNLKYTYDSLFVFIEKYNPDILGVEIRAEDLDSSASYLKRNYPFEMYESLSKYSSKQVFGFDWLGDDIAGKTIPVNYWTEKNIIKKLQQKLYRDSILQQKLAVIDIIQEERKKLALNASLEELNDGRYDLMNRIYYEQLNLLLQHTEFEPLSDFYKKRDEVIAENILEIIKNNKGKKMLFLIGADHRAHAVEKVLKEFEDTIILNHIK